MAGRIAVVLKGYPRLSETFIAQEIAGLERRGLGILVVSLRHPTDPFVHPVHREIAAKVLYLPEYLYQEPGRVLGALARVRRWPRFGAALHAWWRDLLRDPTPNRVRRFGQAAVLADELPDDITALHAHFLHTPASVTRYAAILAGLPWSVSAHAKDIWTTPAWERAEKLADCTWAVTCSAAAQRTLGAHDAARDKLSLVYHGLDLARFPAPERARPLRDGSALGGPARLLTVGRAVEKKGHDVLIEALARLPRTLDWQLVHIGGGKLIGTLKRQAARRGVADRIEWRGALPQEEVISAYREADLFVLASRIGRDGDRDGLPNVLLEAQALGLACVASDVSGVPELIEDGANGLLVPPDDPVALSAALAELIARPDRRFFMGRAGANRVRRDFSFEAGLDRLVEMFGLAVPSAEDPVADDPCESRSTRP